MAALMGEDFADGCEGQRRTGRTEERIQPAARDLDGVLARGRLTDLLAQQFRRTVPAHRNDRGGPGDERAAPEWRRPAAVGVAAVRGEDVDHAPFLLPAPLAVDAETRRAAKEPEPGGDEPTEHAFGWETARGAGHAAAGRSRDRRAGGSVPLRRLRRDAPAGRTAAAPGRRMRRGCAVVAPAVPDAVAGTGSQPRADGNGDRVDCGTERPEARCGTHRRARPGAAPRPACSARSDHPASAGPPGADSAGPHRRVPGE